MKGLIWTVAGKANETGATPEKQAPSQIQNVMCGLRLPDDLLRRIDRFCEDNDVSRSHVFRRGAKLYIQQHEKEDA